ncbi:MAG: DMT family transporter [Candidatus Sumerlaeia bacterium]|nr:DMT family transporter [Candidatus Sumerlaeia bacterium]
MREESSPGWVGPVSVLAGAVLFSTGGMGIKLLSEWPPLAVSAGRSLLTALFFAALLRGRVLPDRAAAPWVAAGALAYCGVVSGFVFGSRLTTAANAILLQSTAPLWIALFGWLWLRERPARGELAALLLGGVGMAFCIGGSSEAEVAGGSALARLGDLVSLASGVAFAALIVLLRHATHRLGEGESGSGTALRMILFGNLVAASFGVPSLIENLGVAAVPERPLWAGLALLAWLGFGQLGGGYFFVQRGLRSTAPLAASLLLLLEPVLNPIWVALAVGEVPPRGTFIGGAFVLAACAAASLGGRRSEASA